MILRGMEVYRNYILITNSLTRGFGTFKLLCLF